MTVPINNSSSIFNTAPYASTEVYFFDQRSMLLFWTWFPLPSTYTYFLSWCCSSSSLIVSSTPTCSTCVSSVPPVSLWAQSLSFCVPWSVDGVVFAFVQPVYLDFLNNQPKWNNVFLELHHRNHVFPLFCSCAVSLIASLEANVSSYRKRFRLNSVFHYSHSSVLHIQ